MDKALFFALHNAILSSLHSKYRRPDMTRMPYQYMLSMILSYLGRACSYDIRGLYQPMYKFVLIEYIWNVIDSINETFSFSFPLDMRALIDIEIGFCSKSYKQVLNGCIGALDGIYFPMRYLGKNILNSIRYFVKRKDKFALLYIACCDSNRKFIYFDCSKCSKSHNSIAFYGTKVSTFIFNCLYQHQLY